tara:strand:+ start:24735 stop:25442 length:708 start_codon:yes stop_codon:yes gene_type:complete
MKKIVVLTGAGISAESGIQTFRGTDGLWEGHNVMEVASPEGFKKNPSLVLDFYNKRRQQLLMVQPNQAHQALTALELHFNTTIITQNIDDLHERAGSSSIVHLHGELLKVRSSRGAFGTADEILEWRKDLLLGDTSTNGYQLRPHIVWFGEHVPLFDKAIEITEQADILIIIGTSMQVYPAASLVNFISPNTPIYVVDPNPNVRKNDFNNLSIIEKTAVNGVPDLVRKLIANFSK